MLKKGSAAPKKDGSKRRRKRLGAPDMTLPEHLKSEPREKQVYQAIRQALMSGALEPGARLSSRSIAESLGVSPMPVREALKRLEADGIIESQAKSGFVVRYLTVAELREILQIRLHLEGMMVREAALKIPASAITKIRKLEKLVACAPDIPTSLARNYEMHFEAYRWASMPETLRIVENIWLRLGPALHHLGGEYTGATSHHSHSLMIEGLANRNPEAAREALQQDLTDAALVMERRLQELSEHEAPG